MRVKQSKSRQILAKALITGRGRYWLLSSSWWDLGWRNAFRCIVVKAVHAQRPL